MRVEIILDPKAVNHRDLVEGLREELRGLKTLPHEEVTEAPPPRTLAVDHNVLKFVFEHPQVITLVTSIVQLVRAVVERTGNKKKDRVDAVIVARNKRLKIPASPQAERRFVTAVAKPKASTLSPRDQAKSKKRKKK